MSGVENFIAHYGTRGMKWGVRKQRVSSTNRTHYDKSPKRLSDAELKRRVARLETEKRYNQLNAKDVSAGKAFVARVLNQSGEQVATKLVVGVAGYGVYLALKKKFGQEHAKHLYPIKVSEVIKKK